MKEIGSEFYNVPTTQNENHIFPIWTQWYISGRGALQAIINDIKNCQTVALPSWCCESMVKPFVDAGYRICFYPVFWDGILIQELRFDCDILYIMEYFGYGQGIASLDAYHGIIIRDVTHSVFSDTYQDADYYFGSLRKWCGLWTGGYAWTGDGHKLTTCMDDDRSYAAVRYEAMRKKSSYIEACQNNNNDQELNKSYLTLFAKAEEILEDLGPLPAAKRDIQLVRFLDVNLIKNCRRKNATVLRDAFPEWLIFSRMNAEDCPLFVPVIVPDGQRDKLRKNLIYNKIYCPTHWPVSDYHRLTKQEIYLYENEISLVCDQRYSAEDMTRIVETIKLFWKKR